MTTKAAKLRIKKHKRKFRIIRSGRPKQSGVMRTESGRKSRSKVAMVETQQEVMSTALNARITQAYLNDGEVLTEKDAKDPLRGFVAGRKYLKGDFGQGDKAKQRLQAGLDTAATWLKCMSICGYPSPNCKAMNMGKVRGLPTEPLNMQERVRIAQNIMMGFEARIPGNLRELYRSVFMYDDVSRENMPEHMDKLLVKSLDLLIDGKSF